MRLCACITSNPLIPLRFSTIILGMELRMRVWPLLRHSMYDMRSHLIVDSTQRVIETADNLAKRDF